MTLGLDEWVCVRLGAAWHVVAGMARATRCGRRIGDERPIQTRYSTADMCQACAGAIGKASTRRRVPR